MSFSYGFYNSLNHDRVYDATVIGQLFDGMIMDGVYSTIGDKFIVHASGQGMRVNVGSGRAWFNHTWNFNDTDYPITPEDAEVILDRIDALVIDVNTQVEYRENQIMFVKGTPSSTPERPTLINSDGHYQYPLAYILIPASSTEVLEANITNMVGTDECPFATGLLQQVSTSELIAQWGAEWRLWSNQEKAAFINWMNSEEADFDSWSDAQKTAFTLWMGEEKTEFDEWFANIQDILDGDVAGHLQNEIDEIKRDGMLGSIFNITTLETTLYGKRVTVSDGTVSKYAEFDNTGSATIKSYESVGNLHFSSTDNTRTAQYDLSVPYYGVYDVELNFWAATVNITAQSAILYGQTVTVKKDNVTVGTCVLSAQGVGVYTATEPGNYIFEISYEDGGVMKTVTQSLTVSAETTYNISFSVGFDLQEWLTAGGVSGTYANLAAVLADEEAVRQLMTKHASVDYLASFEDDDSSVVTILNDNYAAKWISLTDYAMDVLEAAYGTLMGTIGKYGYGEWGITDATTTPPTWGALGNVPVMTSASAPYGEVTVSSIYSSEFQGYLAFNGSLSGYGWIGGASDTTPYIIYSATNPFTAKKARMYMKWRTFSQINALTVTIEGSNTGNSDDWHSLGTHTFSGDASQSYEEWVEVALTNNTPYLKHRAIFNKSMRPASLDSVQIMALQFYGRTLKVSVPKMSGNTTPYGEAFASSEYSSTLASWKAFDQTNTDSNDCWHANGEANPYLGYDFGSAFVPMMMVMVNRNHTVAYPPATFSVQGSNEGKTSGYEDIASGSAGTTRNAKTIVDMSSNTEAYRYCRIYTLTVHTGGTYVNIGQLQFYGKDYSEREWDTEHPRHYIYDHGVECEEIEKVLASNGWTMSGYTFDDTAVKDPARLRISPSSASHGNGFGLKTAIDTTSYTGLHVVDDAYNASDSYMTLYCAPSSKNIRSQVGYTYLLSGENSHYLDLTSINTNVCFAAVSLASASVYDYLYEMWLE